MTVTQPTVIHPTTGAVIHVCFGCKPRTFRPEIPHYSSLRMRLGDLSPPPVSVDWTVGVDPNWGTKLNDVEGDCTIAAFYNAMQSWSVRGRGQEIIQPDSKVQQAYEESCNFNPNAPLQNGVNPTDNGGVEQDVLAYGLNRGFPIIQGPNGRSKLIAFVEVDPRNHTDVMRVINNCGGIYIGTNIPNYLVDGPIPMLWATNPSGDNGSAGGHAVWVPKYDADQLGFVSWGSGAYAMTWDFWDAQVDEAYALCHPFWLAAGGQTPLGMTEAQLEAAMVAMKQAADV